jgi:hypothetical protein
MASREFLLCTTQNKKATSDLNNWSKSPEQLETTWMIKPFWIGCTHVSFLIKLNLTKDSVLRSFTSLFQSTTPETKDDSSNLHKADVRLITYVPFYLSLLFFFRASNFCLLLIWLKPIIFLLLGNIYCWIWLI